MTNRDSQDAVFEGVRDCLVEALGVAPDAIVPEARIIGDLGADSLDLLDITFRLERRFGIRISPRDIEKRAREALGGAPLDIDGAYTPEALSHLRKALPEIPVEELADGLLLADLPRRFRVATMVNMVRRCKEEQHG
jgi:acyl carrier protein